MCTLNPIGYIKSVFTYKNGTPRQPSLCPYARGTVTIEKSLFNNPEHSLEDLDEFSHVWLVFIFHKNNNTFTKAKVKPPRLNGKKVGVFSTRSPYRPNPIGLTLAKLDKVEGSTVYLSGIDLLDGTPILDIKPYIPSYDIPNKTIKSEVEYQEKLEEGSEMEYNEGDRLDTKEEIVSETVCFNDSDNKLAGSSSLPISNMQNIQTKKSKVTEELDNQKQDEIEMCRTSASYESDSCNLSSCAIGADVCGTKDSTTRLSCAIGTDVCRTKESTIRLSCDESNTFCDKTDIDVNKSNNTITKTADWIKSPPIEKLSVRFTNYATEQLNCFSPSTQIDDFRLKYLKSSEEVQQAINDILFQDPRSTYRRKHCIDNLYYFVVDVVHVTAWFNDLIAEVVRLQPVSIVEHCK